MLSGEPTFAGFIKLDDTATWMALTDRIMEHGRDLVGPRAVHLRGDPRLQPRRRAIRSAPSCRSASARELRRPGRRLADPALHGLVGAGARARAVAARGAGWSARRALRALVAFLAAQSALLFGYYLWGGIKEVAAAALIAATRPGWRVARSGESRPHSLPVALLSWARSACSAGGGVWLAAMLVAALPAASFVRGARAVTATRAGRFALTALLLSRCSLPGGCCRPPRRRSQSATALGNLLHPLNGLQVVGIWPAGDFRLDPVDPGAAYVLIAATGVAALVGAIGGSVYVCLDYGCLANKASI